MILIMIFAEEDQGRPVKKICNMYKHSLLAGVERCSSMAGCTKVNDVRNITSIKLLNVTIIFCQNRKKKLNAGAARIPLNDLI